MYIYWLRLDDVGKSITGREEEEEPRARGEKMEEEEKKKETRKESVNLKVPARK